MTLAGSVYLLVFVALVLSIVVTMFAAETRKYRSYE